LRYEVTRGPQTFKVDVHEIGPGVFSVEVDGEQPVRVDAYRSAGTLYSVLVEGRQYEGSVDPREDGSQDVHVGCSAFDFTVIDERRKFLITGGVHVESGKQMLRAKMPGKIVKVLVEVGQPVQIDQGLMVIEAMKMENELRSTIDGIVTGIGVREGETVETNALLAVVEPPAGD
jgi:biotin carboxyl carrier protein